MAWFYFPKNKYGQGDLDLKYHYLMRRKTEWGGITKTVGTCSIDVLDSKYVFGISAPPGEN